MPKATIQKRKPSMGYWVYCRKNKTGTTEALVVQEVVRKGSMDGILFFPYTKGNDTMKDVAYRKAKCYADVNAARFGIPKVEEHCLEEN